MNNEKNVNKMYAPKKNSMSVQSLALMFVNGVLNVIEETNHNIFKFQKGIVFGWLISSIVILSVMVIYHLKFQCVYSEANICMGNTAASAFNALKKPLWTSGVAWVVYACLHGYGSNIYI